MKRNALIAGIIGVFVVSIFLALLIGERRRPPSPETVVRAAPAVTTDPKGPSTPPAVRDRIPVPPMPTAAQEPTVASTPPDADLVTYMRDKFGATLHRKYTQIKAIESLIAYLMKFYPDDWKDRVYDFLKRVFPERADELYQQFEKLNRYKEWLEDSRAEIMQMSPELRRQTLWDVRHSVFGEDADEIWAVELKNEHIQESLEAIAKSAESSVDDKLKVYVDALHGAYGDQAADLLAKRQTELMNGFLSVEAVQENLHALTPEARSEKLREIRQAMGLDEEALQRWDDLDRERDHAWETGQNYMMEREQIVQNYQGAEQQRRLNELRDRLLGPDAEDIRAEEETGFYRYQHRREYGKE